MVMTQKIDSLAAQSYGAVLYDLKLPDEDILKSRKILEECPDVKKVLDCPAVAMEQKLAVIARIFPKSMERFLKCVCRNGRCDILEDIFRAYDNYADEQSRTLRVKLLCVTPPDERQRAGIVRMLARRYCMEHVDLDIVIDKTLIGGFIIEAAGCELDYSMRGRFKQLEKKLSGGEMM